MLYFGLHMHQPTDNLKEAVDNAVKRCYEPLFNVLRNYPEFKFALHCSGWLFEELKQKYPEVFENIKFLAKNGSVEFFTGGFYEPVLAAIPYEDRIEQIKKMNDFIFEEFAAVPKGLWLTERVWQEGIIPSLKSAGVKYLCVDDYHFYCAGFKNEELDGYYLSEFDSKSVGVFPISKQLRYAVPFWEANKAVELIKNTKTAFYFDDAEKFGLWPGTYEWVYEKGWLEEFIKKTLNSVKTAHFSQAFEKKPKGIAYIPENSYPEMGEWSLRAKDALEFEKIKSFFDRDYFEKTAFRFVRGGIWKNFFVKYEESNRLHKRMFYISNRIKSENLYKMQTNDVFWHGIFGGLYLPVLRNNAYKFLCRCEKEGEFAEYEKGDFDFDGIEEVTLRNRNFVCRFYEKGAELIEFLDLKKEFNYQNTLTRRFEAYHEKIMHPSSESSHTGGVKTIHQMDYKTDDEVKKALVFDTYVKNSFVDHFFERFITQEEFESNSFEKTEKLTYTFCEKDKIYKAEKEDIKIEKKYRVNNGLDFEIDITGGKKIYGIEFNFHISDIKNAGIKTENTGFEIYDKTLKTKLKTVFDKEMKILFCPVDTVNITEKGYEITNQGISFLAMCEADGNIQIKGKTEVEYV